MGVGRRLPPGRGVAELRQPPLDLLAAGRDRLEPGQRGLRGVAGGDLLGALAVELAGAGAPHGGEHGGEPEPLEPLDVGELVDVAGAQALEALAGGALVLPQHLELLAQVRGLVVLGDGAVEGVPGLHDVDHGASSTRT